MWLWRWHMVSTYNQEVRGQHMFTTLWLSLSCVPILQDSFTSPPMEQWHGCIAVLKMIQSCWSSPVFLTGQAAVERAQIFPFGPWGVPRLLTKSLAKVCKKALNGQMSIYSLFTQVTFLVLCWEKRGKVHMFFIAMGCHEHLCPHTCSEFWNYVKSYTV